MKLNTTGLLVELKGLHWQGREEERQALYRELQDQLVKFMCDRPEIRGVSTAVVSEVQQLDDIHIVAFNSKVARRG